MPIELVILPLGLCLEDGFPYGKTAGDGVDEDVFDVAVGGEKVVLCDEVAEESCVAVIGGFAD